MPVNFNDDEVGAVVAMFWLEIVRMRRAGYSDQRILELLSPAFRAIKRRVRTGWKHPNESELARNLQ